MIYWDFEIKAKIVFKLVLLKQRICPPNLFVLLLENNSFSILPIAGKISVKRSYPSKREKKRRPTDFTNTATWPKITVGQISLGNSKKHLTILLDDWEALTNIVPLLELRLEAGPPVEKESVLLVPLQDQDQRLPLLRMTVELTMMVILAEKTTILLRLSLASIGTWFLT